MKFDYQRRRTHKVRVGEIEIGGDSPLQLQSMTNTSTMDTEASVEQCKRIIDAGANLVRLTAQGVREAQNMGEIRRRLREAGYTTPLVADIHFNPRAAYAAAVEVEKVRINPGNFVDPGRTFKKIEYTDEEYLAEVKRVEEAVVPFLELCREHGTAIRIGVNHGSLSDRIMSRYGDTPEGMVESAMEFLRVAVKHDFPDVVISIKASNVVVMVETVRRLVRAMEREGMDFPLHLGVTEAGDGEDARIKSAVGIGTLLGEGIGDTIRVSLSEAPEREIPVARMLERYVEKIKSSPTVGGEWPQEYDVIEGEPRYSRAIDGVGGDNVPVVAVADAGGSYDPSNVPDFIASRRDDWVEVSADHLEWLADTARERLKDKILVISSSSSNIVAPISKAVCQMRNLKMDNPIILKAEFPQNDPEEVKVEAAASLGALMLNGLGDGLWIEAPTLSADESARLAYGILQSTRQRITRTEYIACPGCGRTLFALEDTLARIKDATQGLKGLKIGVMGFIVNGPGEMADADYGYVGASAAHVSLYKGKTCIEKNIPAEDAVDHLINLIKREGDWKQQ